jgi:hypothetical protein
MSRDRASNGDDVAVDARVRAKLKVSERRDNGIAHTTIHVRITEHRDDVARTAGYARIAEYRNHCIAYLASADR